jgi:hypothetical protein
MGFELSTRFESVTNCHDVWQVKFVFRYLCIYLTNMPVYRIIYKASETAITR